MAFQESLKRKYEETHKRPNWADEEVGEITEDLINKTSKYLAKESILLKNKKISLKYCGILNGDSLSEGPLIIDVDFNQHLDIALVAGCSRNLGVLTVFQFDGNKNYKIKSIKCPKFPVCSAQFMHGGTKILAVCSSYGIKYVYDLTLSELKELPFTSYFIKNKKVTVCPKDKHFAIMCTGGLIQIYNTKSLSLMDGVTLPFLTRDIHFDNEGSRLFAIGDTGRVFVIDVENIETIHWFFDDGCVEGTAIALSPNGQFIACGSNSGIVNIYHLADVLWYKSPKPLKSIGSLTTPITFLRFNHTSEILAMASTMKDNSMKLVHVRSLEVFQNFPPPNVAFGRVNNISFSKNSKYLSIGANTGKVYYYEMLHY